MTKETRTDIQIYSAIAMLMAGVALANAGFIVVPTGEICKDSKAQIIVNVPTVTGIYLHNGVRKTYNLNEVLEVKEKSGKKRAERIEDLINHLRKNADALIAAMSDRLKGSAAAEEDDDF